MSVTYLLNAKPVLRVAIFAIAICSIWAWLPIAQAAPSTKRTKATKPAATKGQRATAVALPATEPPWASGLLDTERLPAALAARGFVAGSDFKAVVVEVEETADGQPVFRWFSHHSTAFEHDTWWPASTVKFPVAVAALERLSELGFGPNAVITFGYTKEPLTQTVSDVVGRALIPSDNHAYDRLGEIAGFERLNDQFLTPAKGFWRSVLQRGYSGRVKDPSTRRGSLHHSSELHIQEGEKVKVLPEKISRKRYPQCPNHGNCMPLAELAEAMRRVMFHDVLPKGERFRLSKQNLALLREALGSKKPRGNGVVHGLRDGFGEEPVVMHNKPGFALQWFSDVVHVRSQQTGRQWIVAMANQPGREACDEAARHIGAILHEGALRANDPVAGSTPDPLGGRELSPNLPAGAAEVPGAPSRSAP